MAKGRILFIDDDNFLRKVYQAELREKGFDVYLAVDGVDGLQKVSEVNPDLIILDLILPRKNGFEVLRELKQLDETRSIPVVILSNLAQSEDQKKALDLGAVDYLIKDNTTLDSIAGKINLHLSKRTQESKVIRQPSVRSHEAPQPVQKESVQSPSLGQRQLPKRPDRGHNFCPECGYKVAKRARFCPDCGAQLE